jgi:hypothetical protein
MVGGPHVRDDSNTTGADDFRSAASQTRSGFLSEFWFFLRENKKWWLAPLLVVLFGLGLLMALSTTAAAPFIYTLF